MKNDKKFVYGHQADSNDKNDRGVRTVGTRDY